LIGGESIDLFPGFYLLGDILFIGSSSDEGSDREMSVFPYCGKLQIFKSALLGSSEGVISVGFGAHLFVIR
jgi:hypothetical protein